MKNRLIVLAAVCGLLALVPFALAQEATPTAPFDETGVPVQFEAILADLSAQVATTVTREGLGAFTWAEEEYSDASLGCPQEGQGYAQVITRGYRFTLDYNGVTYDYRISQTDNSLVLCSQIDSADMMSTAQANTTGTPPSPGEADATGLIRCDSTLILLTLVAQRDYGFQPASADLTTFEFGQFTSDFNNMMAQATEEPEMEMSTEEAPSGTTADEALSEITLQPGILTNENSACTALRAEVEAYLIDQLRGEMMESEG